MKANTIDYELIGGNMQLIEIELSQGESIVGDAGLMMYMDQKIKMVSINGEHKRGFLKKMLHTGKQLIAGSDYQVTIFTNTSIEKAMVTFAAPTPGRIVKVDLSKIGGVIVCHKGSVLCTSDGIDFSSYPVVNDMLFYNRLEGEGLVFLFVSGHFVKKRLDKKESLRIDASCLVAMTPSVELSLQYNTDIKSEVIEEEIVFGMLNGPGEVWLQSIPFKQKTSKCNEHVE